MTPKTISFEEAREFERELTLISKDANFEKLKYKKYYGKDENLRALTALSDIAYEVYWRFKDLVAKLREEDSDEQQEEVSVVPKDNSYRSPDNGPDSEEHNGVQRMGVL